MAIRKSLAEGFLDFIRRGRGSGISFMQIGANDGVSGDFIRVRALQDDWFGVLVEPSELYMASCKKHYSKSKRVFFERAAVSDKAGTVTLHRVKNIPPDQGWSIGVASLDIEHLLKCGVARDNIITETVPAVTGQSLVSKYNLFNLDLLVIDVEGHEINVVRSFDFSLFFPKFIIFETTHCSEQTLDRISDAVGDQYDFIFDKEDALLIRRV